MLAGGSWRLPQREQEHGGLFSEEGGTRRNGCMFVTEPQQQSSMTSAPRSIS